VQRSTNMTEMDSEMKVLLGEMVRVFFISFQEPASYTAECGVGNICVVERS
jgi:hypothetical protein